MTDKTYKALCLLREFPGVTANQFAAKYFTGKDHKYLFTAVSNQGNGACTGKKAWLCAGSFLGKLQKRGLIFRDRDMRSYRLTTAGEEYLEKHDPISGLVKKDYAIVQFTDPYHGSQKYGFRRFSDTRYALVIDSGLSLKEAQERLLKLFSEEACQKVVNWGVATRMTFQDKDLTAYPTRSDGTRSFSEDIYQVEIVPEDELPEGFLRKITPESPRF